MSAVFEHHKAALRTEKGTGSWWLTDEELAEALTWFDHDGPLTDVGDVDSKLLAALIELHVMRAHLREFLPALDAEKRLAHPKADEAL